MDPKERTDWFLRDDDADNAYALEDEWDLENREEEEPPFEGWDYDDNEKEEL